MPFEITPATTSTDGFSIEAEPIPSEEFAIAAAQAQDAEFGIGASDAQPFPLFIQWQLDGIDLGEPDVAVVDFTGEHLEATRGTGENSHVVTVRDVRDFIYYTSEPYPTEAPESLDAGLAIPQSGFMFASPIENMDAGISIPLDGILGETFLSNQPPENLDATLAIPQAGLLLETYYPYTQPAENLDAALAIPLAGSFPATLLSYTNQSAENLDAALAVPLSGTLV